MKFKKLGKKLMMSGAVCMVLAGGAIPSFASNYVDSTYSYSFGKLNGARYTSVREKQDTSSSYMSCYNITPGYKYTASVVGWSLDKYYDCSWGRSYDFVANTTHFMINNARELGFTEAAIKANAGINVKDVTANGVWSPDSI